MLANVTRWFMSLLLIVGLLIGEQLNSDLSNTIDFGSLDENMFRLVGKILYFSYKVSSLFLFGVFFSISCTKLEAYTNKFKFFFSFNLCYESSPSFTVLLFYFCLGVLSIIIWGDLLLYSFFSLPTDIISDELLLFLKI